MHYTALINHYGYLVLFVALMLELIIFGIPTEIIMGYAGYLVYQGKLSWALAIIVSGVGSSIGISVSYFIGQKLGFPFFKKYGHKVHMGPERFDKFHNWFSKYGNGLIIVAYFIPGIRHITGYFSGITKLEFRKFALFAYIGAFLWVSTFISLGRALGPQWQTFHAQSKTYLVIGGVILALGILIYYLFRRLKGKVVANLSKVATRAPWQTRLSIIGSGVIFVIFFAFLIGLTQDYLANESTQFNNLTTLIIHGMFDPSTASVMKHFAFLSNSWVLSVLSLLALIWVFFLKQDRVIEMIFLVVTIGGGIGLVKGLNHVLQSPNHPITAGYLNSQFLSLGFFMALIIWGFLAYVIVQQESGWLLPSVAFVIVFVVAALLGISNILLRQAEPSNLVTSFILAGVWLSLMIALLDLFRELRRF